MASPWGRWWRSADTEAPRTPATLHVCIAGVGTAVLTADTPRGDVAAGYPGVGDRHGFDGTVPAAPGDHQVCVYGVPVAGSGSGGGLLACTVVRSG